MKTVIAICICLANCISTFSQIATESPDEKTPDAKEIKAETEFLEGMKSYLIDDNKKAIEIWNKSLATYGDQPATWYMVSQAQAKEGDKNTALLSSKKACTLDKDNYDFLYHQYRMELENKLLPEAKNTIEKCIRLSPKKAQNYIVLADVFILLDKEKDAIKTLEDGEKNCGFIQAFSIKKQEILLSKNKVSAALKEGEKASTIDSKYVIKQTQILLQNKKDKEAEDLLLKTIQNDPTLLEAYDMLLEMYVVQSNLTKTIQLNESILKNAVLPYSTKISALKALNKIGKGDKNSQNLIFDACNQLSKEFPKEAGPQLLLSDIHSRADQPNDTYNALLKASKLNPADQSVWIKLCEMALGASDYTSLKENCETAIEYFPNSGYFWYQQGYSQMKLNEFDEAQISYDEALRLNSKNIDLVLNIRANKAWVTASKGDFDKSLLAYEDILSENPTHEQSLKDASILYAVKKSNTKKSVEYATRLITNHGNKAFNYEILAKVLLMDKQADLALEKVDLGLQLNNTPGLLELKGDIYKEKQMFTEAKKYWKMAEEKGNFTESLKQKLKTVEP
ncbi:MAG: tetratricopeptide repeat protein [Leadbetterella sp.]